METKYDAVKSKIDEVNEEIEDLKEQNKVLKENIAVVERIAAMRKQLDEKKKQLHEANQTILALKAAKTKRLVRPYEWLNDSSDLAPKFDEMAMHIARTSKPKKNGAGTHRSWPDARLKILDEMGIEFPEDCKKLASYFLGKGKAHLVAAEAKVKLEREEEERKRQQER